MEDLEQSSEKPATEYEDDLKAGGVQCSLQVFEEKQNEWKRKKVNIAITGRSGTGNIYIGAYTEKVLTHRQHAKIRSGVTVYERNDAVLESLSTEDQCNRFLEALRQSSQTHVVNYITENGGQKCNYYTPPP